MKHLTHLSSWKALQHHFSKHANERMQDWFAQDKERFKQFSIQSQGILLDYSKNRVTAETMRLLCELAREVNLADKINALFNGERVNSTEQRAALHTALRDRNTNRPEIKTVWAKLGAFVESFRAQQLLGATGKPLCEVVNIGIGGSHLGPLMTTHALADFADPKLKCYFVSNVDETYRNEVLTQIDPERVLFVISSKTFTTLETMTHAQAARDWLRKKLEIEDVSAHFVAVTAAPEKAKEFGLSDNFIFPFWEWVGGRYSIWSAIGLPLMLLIGMRHFFEFLDGAHAMDLHFRETEFSRNMPVVMALLGIWYINFFHAPYLAIEPYADRLSFFPEYLQQADMESNGKSVTHDGTAVDYFTGPIIFGKQGCDAQHSFYQLLHQGPYLIPVDFILAGQQELLIASALSQAQALMQGKSLEQAAAENPALTKHKMTPGNRPSNVLYLERIAPQQLGALIALYEHKIFTQSVIWNINAFDQWGVELGKQLLPPILQHLRNGNEVAALDSSTAGLIAYYKKLRGQV